MELKQAIKILSDHNKWRMGDDSIKMVCPGKLGKAIDLLVAYIKDRI